MLQTILKDLHQNYTHEGKVPKNLMGRQVTREKIKLLDAEMKKAIASEDYEQAASLRDQIAALKTSLKTQNTEESP